MTKRKTYAKNPKCKSENQNLSALSVKALVI